jgi:hypothetical protein
MAEPARFLGAGTRRAGAHDVGGDGADGVRRPLRRLDAGPETLERGRRLVATLFAMVVAAIADGATGFRGSTRMRRRAGGP